MSLLAICLALAQRPPDLVIGGEAEPYLRRWYLIPRNRLCNLYLHQFLRDDDDRALHDHPWPNCSLLLAGEYDEVVFAEQPEHGAPLPLLTTMRRRPGRPIFRRAAAAHRVVLLRDADGNPQPCWSLFFTGANLRSWGFWCPRGRWVHWRSFTAGPRGEVVGAGCGDPTLAAIDRSAAGLRQATEEELMAQRESWARGQMGIGDDAQEAAERERLRREQFRRENGG